MSLFNLLYSLLFERGTVLAFHGEGHYAHAAEVRFQLCPQLHLEVARVCFMKKFFLAFFTGGLPFLDAIEKPARDCKIALQEAAAAKVAIFM
jgi:hypothetical protein